MATRNRRGGWNLTDDDVAEIARASGWTNDAPRWTDDLSKVQRVTDIHREYAAALQLITDTARESATALRLAALTELREVTGEDQPLPATLLIPLDQ